MSVCHQRSQQLCVFGSAERAVKWVATAGSVTAPCAAAEDFASVGGDSPTSSVASSGASAYNSAASLPGSAVCACACSVHVAALCFCL